MARSLKKGPFFDDTPTRRSTILPSCVNESFAIHNGKQYFQIKVTDEMIGHKFGEFVRTKKKALHVKKKGKRK